MSLSMQGGILYGGLYRRMNMHLYLLQEFSCFMKLSQQLIWEELIVYTVSIGLIYCEVFIWKDKLFLCTNIVFTVILKCIQFHFCKAKFIYFITMRSMVLGLPASRFKIVSSSLSQNDTMLKNVSNLEMCLNPNFFLLGWLCSLH
jgi:hypothetical protein